MVQNINNLLFLTSQEYSSLGSSVSEDTLYFVSYPDKSLKVFFGSSRISNVESVKSLSTDLPDDTFYILISESEDPLSVYYKCIDSGEVRFVPVCDFRLKEISLYPGGVFFSIEGAPVRVLSLDSQGKFLRADLEYILSGVGSNESFVLWESI